MAEVQNLKRLMNKLQSKIAAKVKDSGKDCVVGYTQAYALYVHENLEAYHHVGQAKFLEQPARALSGDLAQIVTDSLEKGRTISQSLLLAGLRLQRESQQLCPVDTGALKNSAFTRLEDAQ